jgi:hypothetical protein
MVAVKQLMLSFNSKISIFWIIFWLTAILKLFRWYFCSYSSIEYFKKLLKRVLLRCFSFSQLAQNIFNCIILVNLNFEGKFILWIFSSKEVDSNWMFDNFSNYNNCRKKIFGFTNSVIEFIVPITFFFFHCSLFRLNYSNR